MYRGEATCPSCWQPNTIESAERKGTHLCRCCQTSFKWHVCKAAPGAREAIHAVPLTPAERLAQLTERCDPSCDGWAIFNEDTDPVLQICEDCWAGHPEPLTDDDLLKIPAAFEALCRHRRCKHTVGADALDLDDHMTHLVRLHQAKPEARAAELMEARHAMQRIWKALREIDASLNKEIEAVCDQAGCEFRDFFE